MPLTWHQGLAVGVPEMDGQHRKLLDLINDLEAALDAGRDPESLGDIARRMQDYARYHFATEEKRMAYACYPDTEAHRAEHASFIAQAQALDPSRDIPAASPRLVLEFLRNWLVTHISGTDKTLGAFLQGM